MDLESLRHRCTREYSAEQCYQAFSSGGLDYGPGFRAIDTLFVGADLVLARLSLPASVSDTRFGLHPSLMDAALQACIGLVAGPGEPHARQAGIALPFALDALEIFGACTSVMWAVICFSPTAGRVDPMRKLDIDLCDETGKVCVRMQGFSTRSANAAQQSRADMSTQGTLMLTPVWDPVTLDDEQAAFPASSDRVLLVAPAGETALGKALRQRYPAAKSLVIEVGTTIDTIVARLDALGAVDHLFWLATAPTTFPLPPGEGQGEGVREKKAPHGVSLSADALVLGQEQGVLQMFRLIKALLRTGYGDKSFALTALTTRSLPVCKHDEVDPTHAAVHGLIGSLAKEYPHWRVRCLDLDDLHTVDAAVRVVDELVQIAPDPEGHTRAYRMQGEGRSVGQWFRQQLLPLTFSNASMPRDHPDLALTPALSQGERGPSPGIYAPRGGGEPMHPPDSRYRQGGVYVVIGGAGGIGEVWSEYMMRTYGARLVWIGRRQKDQAIQTKLERLAKLGHAPLYLSADATDREALRRAYEAIKREHDQIHGVVHAAIVLLDKSLANMDEADFRAGLAAKVNVCVRLAQVFAKEPLDFVLFFSSMTAFSKAAGQSNYAAGCTFKDAFARQLARAWTKPDGGPLVKIMNWGYWGHVGIVSSRAYQERMAQAGVGSIEPGEGMAALESLLVSPVDQVALLKMTRAIDGLDQAESLTVYHEPAPSCIGMIQVRQAAGTGQAVARVRETLLSAAATVLGVDVGDIDTHVDLTEYGFDAVAFARLANLFNQALRLGEAGEDGRFQPLTADRLLRGHAGAGLTLDALAEYLLDQYPALVAETSPATGDRRDAHEAQPEGSAGEIEARAMEDLICQLLWGQLRSCGFFDTPDGNWRPSGWPVLYERWLAETIAVLVGKGYLQYASHGPITDPFAVVNGPGILATSMDAAAFWHEWDRRQARWLADPDKKALIILLETTLRALPEILSGKRPATDVIFPNSSLELVEDIYKRNAVADRFNTHPGRYRDRLFAGAPGWWLACGPAHFRDRRGHGRDQCYGLPKAAGGWCRVALPPRRCPGILLYRYFQGLSHARRTGVRSPQSLPDLPAL